VRTKAQIEAAAKKRVETREKRRSTVVNSPPLSPVGVTAPLPLVGPFEISLGESILKDGACGIELSVSSALSLIGKSFRLRNTLFNSLEGSVTSPASSGGWTHTDVAVTNFAKFTKSLLSESLPRVLDALLLVLECDLSELEVGLQRTITGKGFQEYHRDTSLGQRKVVSLMVTLDSFGVDTHIILGSHTARAGARTPFAELPAADEKGTQPFLGLGLNAVLMDTNCLHRGNTHAANTESDKLIYNFASRKTLEGDPKVLKSFENDFGKRKMFCNVQELLK
jgi:hypothetical protein